MPTRPVEQAKATTLYEKTNIVFLQGVIHELNEKCWDTCMDKPSNKLDSRTESCIRNCVDRFLDTNIFVTERLQKKAGDMMAQQENMQ
jgi:hypothetical protein